MAETNGNGNGARWQLTFGLIGSGTVILGALISFFISMSTLNVEVANLQARLATIEQQQSQIIDRTAESRSFAAVTDAKLIEIETQFCASDIVRNLMHANDMRISAMLWHKSFPTMSLSTDNAYYPQICNRSITNILNK